MDDIFKARWEHGKGNTLYFYRKKLPWKEKALNRERYLPDYLESMIGDKKEVSIAELGAGMFCTIGSLSKTAKVKMYVSDALADEFNQIIKEAGVTPLIPLTKENMEKLSYPDNFFDIVYCCNALDHTTDPIKAIKEMYRVCKRGGYIYLRHFANVGEGEGYQGLHMWNIDFDGKNLIVWNKEHKSSVEDFVPGFKTSVEIIDGARQVVSILNKK